MRRRTFHRIAAATCLPLLGLCWSCTPTLQGPNDLGLLSLTGGAVLPGPTFSVSGSMLGLSSSAVLSLNGTNDLTVQADGTFTFAGGLAAGSTYQVTVKSQPSAPIEYCSVTGGSGTLGANVTGVEVACFQLPDSGQGSCHGAGGGLQGCGGVPLGQDGDFASQPAAIQFIAQGDATVRETASMLLWQQCPPGTTWTGSNCTGSPIGGDRITANSYCAGLTLAGQNWRLPTTRELLLSPDYGLSAPAMDTSIFSATPGGAGSRFWTSDTNTQNTGRAWTVDAARGNTDDHSLGSLAFMRCVSGPAVPAHQFVSRDTNVVYDQSTNLTWTKCSMANFGPPGTIDPTTSCGATPVTDNWDSSVTACSSLVFAGRSDWRLPSVRELATLLDFQKVSIPLIDTAAFPNTGLGTYWTSTSSDQTDTEAWRVDFSNFVVGTAGKSNNSAARCVATGP